MGLSVVFIWVCALLIDSRRLRDVCLYMSVVAAVDIGLFYLVERGRHGAEVRGGFTHAFLAAERVRWLAERAPNTDQDQRQPDSKDSNEPVPVGVGGTAP
jgi:hypothetical protein